MKKLLLAGSGYAHLQVLKNLALNPSPNLDIRLITPHLRQLYSGTLPNWMAGHYGIEECSVLLEPLIKASGVHFVQDHITGVDSALREVSTEKSGVFSYDVLSLATGGFVDTQSLLSPTYQLLPLRPVEDFLSKWQTMIDCAKKNEKIRIAVLGGGATGFEIALATHYRLTRKISARYVQISLIVGKSLLQGYSSDAQSIAAELLHERRITIIKGRAHGGKSGLVLSDENVLPVDFVIVATAATPAPWMAKSGLALAPDGFIAVRDGQQSVSDPFVFAAGDCASRIDFPHPKSGIYAIKAGPALSQNLHRQLEGQPLLHYAPQKRSFNLMGTGSKEALMNWGSVAAHGYWIWRLKDWQDRRFMRQYTEIGS